MTQIQKIENNYIKKNGRKNKKAGLTTSQINMMEKLSQ